MGTGMLGTAVGLRLIARGHEVVAHNRTRAGADRLEAGGASVAGSPAGVAAECGLVITCVKDAAAVSAVSFGPGGIAAGAGGGLVVCDMSTIEPAASREISGRYAGAGVAMLDTPVMGGPAAALAGELVMMAAGDRGAFDEHRPLLGELAGSVFYMGGAGAAHATKLAMNLQIAMLALSLSEGIELSRASSVDPGAFLEVLNATYFGTGMSRNKALRMAAGSFEPTFLLRNLRKDLRAINATAASRGLELPMGSLAEELYAGAEGAGLGGLDYTGILAYLESRRGGRG